MSEELYRHFTGADAADHTDRHDHPAHPIDWFVGSWLDDDYWEFLQGDLPEQPDGSLPCYEIHPVESSHPSLGSYQLLYRPRGRNENGFGEVYQIGTFRQRWETMTARAARHGRREQLVLWQYCISCEKRYPGRVPGRNSRCDDCQPTHITTGGVKV